MSDLPFNRPFRTGAEGERLAEALASGWTGGNGPFCRRCEDLLRELTGARRVLLTHSCTGALEMAALLAGAGPGDEVIVPSFTFPTTASAFALRGATPVFVDVRADTLTLDPTAVAEAITPATKAIVPVHYAGGACAMDTLGDLAAEHGAMVVEDAAQGVGASWRGRPLGSIGALGTLSFHETKNLSCGEGGALVINDERLVARAEVLQEKGTDRARFMRGEIDRYTWVDLGSSFVLSDLAAAVLIEQLEHLDTITRARVALWDTYDAALQDAERRGLLRRPRLTPGTAHNGHIFYVLAEDGVRRDAVIDHLRADGIHAYFHYSPLHASPAGRRFGRSAGDLPVTTDVAARLVRLPLWAGMRESDVERVAAAVVTALERRASVPAA